MSTPRFVLVAGETSGDLLGEALIADLRKRFPDAQFAGIGGPRMADAGMTCWHAAEELAVMGFAEVLSHLPRLLGIRRDVVRRSLAWGPACYIGIDAPDFNLGVERRLKERGVPTVHYVSPSIWAWRSKRARKIGASADRVLTLFPFEPEIYARHQVDARFVGHPLAELFPDQPDKSEWRAQLGIEDDGQLLAVLPGSRGGEIERLGPAFARAMKRLHDSHPDLRFLAPAATARTAQRFRQIVAREAGDIPVHWFDGRSREVMMASDAILLASGTAALEALLAKRPMVVGYRIAHLSYFLVKALRMMETDRYSLPNVLAGRAVVPEILQYQMTDERLADEIARLLDDPMAAQAQTHSFQQIHQCLRTEPGTAAAAIAELLPGGDA